LQQGILYLEEVNMKTNEVRKLAKDPFGKQDVSRHGLLLFAAVHFPIALGCGHIGSRTAGKNPTGRSKPGKYR
jgi:hypothetical protein